MDQSGGLVPTMVLGLSWLQELGRDTWLLLNQGQVSPLCSPWVP